MQTETTVSARSSAHQGHLADDPFSRDFDLTDLLSIAPAPTPTAIAKALVSAVPKAVREPEPEAKPTSRNDIFTAYLQFEREISRLSAEQGRMRPAAPPVQPVQR